MKVLDPGHKYKLRCLDGGASETLSFVKREGRKYPGNKGHYPGTTLQEVLRALIDRCTYINKQIPSKKTREARMKMVEAIRLLEERAAERHKRAPLYTTQDELLYGPFCRTCGHVQCNQYTKSR